MDIGPISAVRPVTMIKPSPGGPDLSRVFEVEYHGQSGDDQYTPAHKKAARGLEDEEDEVVAEESPTGAEARPEGVVDSGKVSFFA